MKQAPSENIQWFAQAIRMLPSDEPVPDQTAGYNKYNTQKAHWLGWLDPSASTGTYPRQSNSSRDARDVYNRIVEPKLLSWLISAAGVHPDLIEAALLAASAAPKMASQAAAIRRHVPWSTLAAALKCRASKAKP